MTNTIVRENRSNMFNGSLSKDEMMKTQTFFFTILFIWQKNAINEWMNEWNNVNYMTTR